MHESPPIYRVTIEEITSKRTIVSGIYEGPLAPMLQDDGEIAVAVADTDAKRFWRKRPYRGRNVATYA